MKATYRIGLLQFDVKWEDIPSNIDYLTSFLQNQKYLPDLLVLPEMFTTGFTMKPNELDQSWLTKQFNLLQDLSQKHTVGLIGSLVASENNNFYNRLILFSPDQDFQVYDKRHLFRIGGEPEIYNKGTSRKNIVFKDLNIFPQVCYDLRFPVWSRNNLNYHALINVANWPAARHDVWLTLLKARAIENQCFVIGVNRVGTDKNGIEYLGGSVAYNAKGEKLCLMNNEEGYEEIEIDLHDLEKFRNKFPVYKDADSFKIKNRE